MSHAPGRSGLVPDFGLPHVDADSCLLPQRSLHHCEHKSDAFRICGHVDVILERKEELRDVPPAMPRAAQD